MLQHVSKSLSHNRSEDFHVMVAFSYCSFFHHKQTTGGTVSLNGTPAGIPLPLAFTAI